MLEGPEHGILKQVLGVGGVSGAETMSRPIEGVEVCTHQLLECLR